MFNVLVTGSRGQLGSEIQALSNQYKYNFFFKDSRTLDITQREEVYNFIEKNKIDVVVNCAAYTSVDKAEEDKKRANLVNHLAVRNLAKIIKEKKLKLIHISSDYVFNGQNFKPYTETDTPSANGVYGQTKLDGEKAIQEINPINSIIIRTSWLYSSFGANFLKTMLKLGKEKENLEVVFDQVGTPTYAKDLAKIILDIIPKINNNNIETYHYSNEGVVSWYDFAKEIMYMAKLDCVITPIESKAYSSRVKRPPYSLLNKTKIKKTFNVTIPFWKDSLEESLNVLRRDIKELKTVLVIGGNGKIGKSIVTMLLHKNFKVKIFTNNSNRVNKEVTYYDFNTIEEAFIQTDYIIFSFGSVKPFDTDIKYFYNEFISMKKFIYFSEKYKIKKSILLSSGGAVYGNIQEGKAKEDDELKPVSLYGYHKVLLEEFLQTSKIPFIILRVSNPFGFDTLNNKKHGLINTIIKKVILNEKVEIFGDGSNIKDYIFIEDVTSAIRYAITSDEKNIILNIGSGEAYSIQEIVHLIEESLKIKVKITYKPKNDNDIERIYLNIDKAKQVLNWIPNKDIKGDIIKTYKKLLKLEVGDTNV